MKNDLLEKNLTQFSKRFEHLHTALLALIPTYSQPEGVELFTAKNSEISATFKNNYIHSSYNPSAEAKKLILSNEVHSSDSIVFLGVGLGYAPIECAKNYTNKTIIIVEPNPFYILLSFSVLDWSSVFEHSSLVFLIEAPQQTVITILEQYGLHDCHIIAQKILMQHAGEYFENIQKLIERNLNKQSINMRTLERFSTLWLSNMCKNFAHIEKLPGINKYEKKANNLPACVLAAGPTLDEVLPHLHEIKKRSIIICVDTALKACLSVGVQPHFILLVDPQYWNARHIDGLQAPESIFITESAAYPSVFRFPCKEILLCSSLFPLGKYAEKFTGKKGELAAGGSVATSAWDFARFIGCKEIYMAGLDLSFPGKQTHTKGSTFEEKSHIESAKLKTSETFLSKVLYNPHTEKAFDYNGKETITDARMKLYAWWFESKCATFKNIKTYSLSSKSLAIPLIEAVKITHLLNLQEAPQDIENFINTKNIHTKPEITENILESLLKDFSSLSNTINKGIHICNKHYKNDNEYEKAIHTLSEIDMLIYDSSAKNIVSLVFPNSDTLQSIIQEKLPYAPPPPPKGTYAVAAQYNIDKTKIVYELIKKSIDLHLHYLRKNT